MKAPQCIQKQTHDRLIQAWQWREQRQYHYHGGHYPFGRHITLLPFSPTQIHFFLTFQDLVVSMLAMMMVLPLFLLIAISQDFFDRLNNMVESPTGFTACTSFQPLARIFER